MFLTPNILKIELSVENYLPSIAVALKHNTSIKKDGATELTGRMYTTKLWRVLIRICLENRNQDFWRYYFIGISVHYGKHLLNCGGGKTHSEPNIM